jgi:thiol-disulfide isomerase/thioredoxin
MITTMIASRQCLLATLVSLALAGCGKPEVELADGGGASWDQWQGQWLLINYWAEWCAPCRKEIPELNRLHSDGQTANVVVLGVNFDGLRGRALTELMEKLNIRFPVLVNDPGARWERSPPTVLPSTLVIDPEGVLREVLVGPQSYESLARAVEMTSEV